MSFIVYDLTFLVLFGIFASIFLYRRRHNLKRQGWMFLYHAKWGIPLMDRWAKKYEKILKPMQYVIVGLGHVLMVAMTWLLITTVYEYVSSPFLAKALKIPPLLPLFPYFPQIFKIESIFPPFYFTYFILAIAIVAIGHEFAHGLFARLNKVRIKSTGFAFFGPFFGAFVEQDDKDMNKIKKFPQLAILAAGVFANVILCVIFGLILWGFFATSFVPAGINFNTYATSTLTVAGISSVNGINISSIQEIPSIINDSLIKVGANNSYLFVPGESLKTAIEKNIPQLTGYEDTPALEARLKGAIVSIDGEPTRSAEELRFRLGGHKPGDVVMIRTVSDDVEEGQSVKLADREGHAYLGVGMIKSDQTGIRGAINKFFTNIKDPFVYYVPTWGGDFAWFVYYLLWWIFMINILVALFNMLPLSILDGGRFFYITIWGLTGKELWGRKAFKVSSWFFAALFALMMVRWIFVLF